MKRMTRREFLGAGSQTMAAWLFRHSFIRHLVPTGAFVESLWSGAITPNSARVNAKIDHDSDSVRLLVSTNPDLSSPLSFGDYMADTLLNNRMVSMFASGLNAGTTYYYGVESNGVLDGTRQGRFHTPLSGPQSFTFAFGACAGTGSEHEVFEVILAHNPLLFLHTGDMHYEDIGENDRDLFRAAFDEVLASSTQGALYSQVPIAYVWDDHDYGDNNSGGDSPSREAARLTYQEYVPHYPLPAGSGNVPIYQAFTIGRVRFILTDLRSERAQRDLPDIPEATMMGSAQKAWFKNELLAAKNLYGLIVWVSSVPWIAPASDSADHWGGYAAERQELSEFIEENGINNLLMLCGDAHMVALDDGSNTNYAGGSQGFPLMHAAALDRNGAVKGGPYSHGAYPGGGQYGLVTINDQGGDSLSVQLSGRTAGGEVLVAYEFSPVCCPELNQPIYLPAVYSGAG